MSRFLSCNSSSLLALVILLVVPGLRATAQRPNLETLWADLADQDAGKAYRAIWALALTPEKTVTFLKARLTPLTADRQQIDKLVRDLDSKGFSVRARASAELEKLCEAAEAPLRQALQGKPGLEMKRRIERLLAQIPKAVANPTLVRRARALEVLEHIDTPEARKLLARLMKGNAAAWWTQMAQAAHKRLANRPRPAPAAAPLRVDYLGDPVPAGTLARLGTVRLQNNYRATVTPDGKTLVGVTHKYLHLWDTTTARELPGYPKRKDWPLVRAVAISPSGKLLAVVYQSGNSFDICELPSGKLLWEHRHKNDHGFEPSSYTPAFSSDSKKFIIANQVATQIWDMTTGKKLWEFPNVHGYLYVAAVSPGGKRLVTCSYRDNRIHIVDVATGKVLHDLGAQKMFVGNAVFSRDGIKLATSSSGPSVRIWDVATGKLEREISMAGGWFAFSPDGTTLALLGRSRNGSNQKTILLCNVADARAKPRVLLAPPGIGGIQGFSPDGKTLLWRTGHSVRLLDATTGKDRHGWTYRGGIFAVAWSPNNAIIATGCDDGTVGLWDAASTKPRRTMVGHGRPIASLVFSPDSKYLLSCSDSSEPAVLWDTATGTKKAALPRISWARFSADGKFIFTGRHPGKRWQFETATGKVHSESAVVATWTWAMAFSPDGRRAATGGGGGNPLCVYDLVDRKVRHVLKREVYCSSAAFSPDGCTLATLLDDRGVILWDVVTGRERARFPMERVFSSGGVAFSPDSRVLAWASYMYPDPMLHVVDLATGKQLGPFPGHLDAVIGLAFSPDGRRLATASNDGTVLIHALPKR